MRTETARLRRIHLSPRFAPPVLPNRCVRKPAMPTAWSESRTMTPGVWMRRFRGLPQSSTSREFSSKPPDSTYEQANVASTRGVVEAAKRSGVQKIVLVSATGADETSRNRYYRTKGQAEALVRASGLNYTVLRAPLLLGPGTAGGAALGRHVSHSRAKLIGGGRNLQQPLCVDDLARAAVAATTPSVANNLVLDLVGPVSLPERELVERAARLLGRQVRIGSIPKYWFSLVLAIRQRIGRPGFSRDALDVITADTRPESATGRVRARNQTHRNRRND